MEVFPDILDEIDGFLDDPATATADEGERLMALAEQVLVAWNLSRGAVPTDEASEGFRLLALHRQGAKGTPSFNACRETCREIVFRRNAAALYHDDAAESRHQLQLMAMTAKHLTLFVGGKMTEAGLGDFCCSSRPLHQVAGAA